MPSSTSDARFKRDVLVVGKRWAGPPSPFRTERVEGRDVASCIAECWLAYSRVQSVDAGCGLYLGTSASSVRQMIANLGGGELTKLLPTFLSPS